LVLACSGCTIPTFTNPLVNPSDAKSFPTLHGVYRTTDCPTNLVMYEHVGPAGDGYPNGILRIISVAQPKDAKTPLRSTTYFGFVEQIGRHYILHLALPKSGNLDRPPESWNEKWDVTQVGGYLVLKLSAIDDGFEMAPLNDVWLAEQIRSNQLAGQVTQDTPTRDGATKVGGTTITVTADAEALREFFTRHIDDKLFDKPSWKYTRVK
jgi:hypothetical protein